MKPDHNKLSTLIMAQCTALALAGAGSALGASNDAIPELSGVWQWGSCYDGTGFGCMILDADDELLTDRAKAVRDALEEAAQPKYDCAPISIPHMWTDPYSHQIEQLDDRVIFTYGKDDVVRTVWLEGSNHTEPHVNEFTYFGHSHGRYENGELIVVTNKFAFDPQGLNADFKLASSTQKQVTERYWLEDGALVIEVSTIDTFFLKEPWVYKVKGQRDPNELALPWACELEGSRDILKLMPSDYPNDPPIQRIEFFR